MQLDVWTMLPCVDAYLLREAVKELNECQTHYRARWRGDCRAAMPADEPDVSWSEAERRVRPNLKGHPSLVFTSAPLVDGRFFLGDRDVGLISTHRWDRDDDPPRVDTFALFGLALALYRITAGFREGQANHHAVSVGCLLDGCTLDEGLTLHALKVRLRCGYLCAYHRGRFAEFESRSASALEAIERVLDRVRDKALGKVEKRMQTTMTSDQQESPLFSWIHLSDIHIGHGDASHRGDQKLVLDALRADVERMLTRGAPKPDTVLVTGDIAFSGANRDPEEYADASALLIKIVSTARLPLSAVFLVPGNHDVQRKVDDDFIMGTLVGSLRDGTRSLDALFADATHGATLSRRQENYRKFAAQFGPQPQPGEQALLAAPFWRHTLRTRHGLDVRLVGLNTALLAADETKFGEDRSRLRVGKRQLEALFGERDGATEPLVMVLGHHPLHGNWLADESEVRGWVQRHAHIHLTGHVHDASSDQLRSGGGREFVTITAGAVHGEPVPEGTPARHGYSFGSVIASGDKVKLRVWPRMWSHKRKEFRADGDNLEDGTLFHEHELSRVVIPETVELDR